MPEEVAEWKGQKEAPASVWGIRILLLVYRILGRRVARWMAAAVLLLCYPFLRAARRASADFQGHWEAYTGKRFPGGGFRHLCCFCHVMLDRVACWGGIFPGKLIQNCTPDAVERLTRDFHEGRGAFLVVSHLGNVELLRTLFLPLAREKGVHIHVYLDMELSQRFNSVLKSLDKEGGMVFHSTNELGNVGAAMGLAEEVEQGNMVIMAGDRVPRMSSRAFSTREFFGKPARFPNGTFRLASALGCPVYGAFLPAVGGRYELHLVPMSEGDAPAAGLCDTFVRSLEQFTVRHPLNWHNFYPFWS